LACSATDAGQIAKALKASNIQAALFGPDALLAEQYWEVAGNAGEGTMVSFAADPLVALEAKPIIARLKEPSGVAVSSYAAVQIFASSLQAGKTYKTVLGPISFDAKGDIAQNRFVWYRWFKGQYSEVK
jgi:branched-chain amino acid transport system substrate-binding protein